jgi:hypothetical protein
MKTRLLTILAAFFAVIGALDAQTYSRINDLPVRNTPVSTDSIPASDAAGVNWRIPFSKFGGGGTGGIPTTTDVLAGNGAGAAVPLGSGTGVKLMLQTPTSANIKAAITDDLGVSGGKLIFSLGQLNISAGKIFSANNTLTLTGTDGSTVNFGAGGTIATVGYTGSFSDLSGTGSVVLLTNSNIYSPGKAQIFVSNNADAGLGFNLAPSDPPAPAEARVWYRSNTHRLMYNNGSANVALATTAEAGGAASEATVSDANATWPNGVTTLRSTSALSAVRSTNLPAAAAYPPGTPILYIDQVSSPTSAFGRAFSPGGGDTLNGAPFTPFIGNGNARFETDGVSKWTPLDTRAVVKTLQDPNDPTKQANFDVSGMTTGTTATITVKGTGPIPLPSTAITGQFVRGLDASGNLIYGTPAGSGDALTTLPLSQFAPTTSAQFTGVISDENAPDGPTAKVLAANGSVSIATGKTATFSNSVTIAGTDGAALTVSGTGGTIPVGSAAYSPATAFAPAGASAVQILWLTTVGSGTYTTPTGCRSLYVEMVAGGGGSAGALGTATSAACAGGGGGGQYAATYIATPAATYSYTVGDGGTAGAATPTAGGAGADTIFGPSTAHGGLGSAIPTAGTTNVISGAGGQPFNGTCGCTIKLAGGNGDHGIRINQGNGGYGGRGGTSFWATSIGANNLNGSGAPGNIYGGGASGGNSNTATGQAGAAGGQGAIKITAYF